MIAGPAVAGPRVAAAMADEARALVERAQAAGVTLRMIGGVAVRWLLMARAPQAAPPRRTPPRDIDLVGLRRQTKAIAAFMSDAGFEENRAYRLNSGGAMMQFFRHCLHAGSADAAHPDDRVDVYLDDLLLEHWVRLSHRLGLCTPTLPASDVVLAKLLRADPTEDDIDDALALVRQLPFRARGCEDSAGAAGLATVPVPPVSPRSTVRVPATPE